MSVELPTPSVIEIVRCEVGSTLHGIDTGGDLDLMSVAIEPRRAVTGLQTWEQWTWRSAPEGQRSGPGDVDWTVYGLRKYLRLALKGNPSIIALLYAPAERFTYMSVAGKELCDLRGDIVSQACIPRYLGYLHSQRHRALQGKGSGRGAREGRSSKWASHMVRLGYEALEIATTGEISLPMREEHAAKCRAIKRGDIPFSDALDLAGDLESQVRAVNSPELPPEPNTARVEDWLHGVYIGEYGP